MAKLTGDSWDRFVPVFVLKQEVYKNCKKIMVTTENCCRRLLNVIALIRFFWQPWLAIGDTEEEGFGKIFLLSSVFHACLEIILILCRC